MSKCTVKKCNGFKSTVFTFHAYLFMWQKDEHILLMITSLLQLLWSVIGTSVTDKEFDSISQQNGNLLKVNPFSPRDDFQCLLKTV